MFLLARTHLLTSDMCAAFLTRNALKYSSFTETKCTALSRCFGFVDVTVIGIARPGLSAGQNSAYNGHKRRNAPKFQILTGTGYLILHAHGPLEGFRHDWALYVRGDLEGQLEAACHVGGVQFLVHDDSGYNHLVYLDTPFSDSNLIAAQRMSSGSTSAVRVTVGWMCSEVRLYWTVAGVSRNMRFGESPVGFIYIVALIITNFRNCLYSNTGSQYLACPLPSLEEFLTHKD